MNFKEEVSFSNEIDFSKPPATVFEYKIGNKITRENFASFLILSFSVSRGSLPVQHLFFAWLFKKYHQNIFNIIYAFLNVGGWKVLSEEEKANFVMAFEKVQTPGHKTNKIANFSVNEQIELSIDSSKISEVTSARNFFNLDEINSITDFNRCAGEYLKEVRK